MRFPEGFVHGFLTLRIPSGETLARGDLLRSVDGSTVENRMLLRFSDGSRSDERVVFTQDGVLRLVRYRLIQEGPSFPTRIEATFDATTGAYRVVSRERDGGAREVAEDALDEVPPDLYGNGMMPIVVKNLDGAGASVHVLALTPEPQVVRVDVALERVDTLALGGMPLPVQHYVLQPRLGALREAAATLLGRNPPDNHIWLVAGDAPGFVRFRGPLYVDGPIWQIDLAAPSWPR